MANIITPILKPFANGRLTSPYPNVLPSVSANNPDMVANQETGFPVAQLLPLTTTGSTPVKEEEMNGVLYFYTNLLYQAGLGYQYTFDANLSAAIGGYSLGAVLYCSSNGSYQKSLKDNNTANFVSNTSYINDGTNWKQITYNVYDVFPDIENDSGGNVYIGYGRTNNALVQLGAYSAPGGRAFLSLQTINNNPQMTLNIYDNTQSLNNGIFLTLNQRPQLNLPTPVTPSSLLALPFNNQSFLVAQDILSYNITNGPYALNCNVQFIRRGDGNYNILIVGRVDMTSATTISIPLNNIHAGISIVAAYGPASVSVINATASCNTNVNADNFNIYAALGTAAAGFTVYFELLFVGTLIL